MLLTMMYQCCIIALMIAHSVPAATHQSSAPTAFVVYTSTLKSTMTADDSRTWSHGIHPENLLEAPASAAVRLADVEASSSSYDSASRREGTEYKTNQAGSRNSLESEQEKSHSTKHRTVAGPPMSPSLSDSENPSYTADLEMNTNPSTTQRNLSAVAAAEAAALNEDETTGRMNPTVPSMAANGGNVSLSLIDNTMLLLPSGVPVPQQQQQSQPQFQPLPQQQQQQQQQQQRHRTINSMNLNPTTPAMLVKPVNEHRKLLKSTGPILNYVFDSHPPYYKSTYYNVRYGPHFETDNVTNITVQNGDDLFLSCRISLLQDKTVSWVRRKHGETDLQLLTVGKQTYSGDPRYTIEFQYPNNWRLKIAAANKNDEGVYECQISTHPPKVIIYYLHVNAPEVLIVDEEGEPLYDKYYEVGSTIKLMCRIRHMSMLRSAVYWIHNENILNHDVQRGGISVKTNLTTVGANSTLFVAKVNKQDSGSYTCSIGPNQHYSVSVHVLNGTANPYGIYQRSCAFSALLETVDLRFILKQLLFLLVKHLLDR
ncbi:uncharacterized protein LOC131690863 [Topomyia yanbarensis]|uniref:uncharacterized protein LOC131690863 n=1 Tax=Topomyia yanbarensis TaxID=2498891 RepID=UPI00273C294A|nr:uncharacterized protein LOC131690863 [Topomyia yanbarensis]XP_058832916.1 uncharacterized protein LOC131690863 [Topomyia yanbarensis]XP_058832917.1 uncharacterized protein LOC131690863 [Topomyia yanbarensis]XP_058832918.1 uncharacterized protein LOC131690863 [Topomyia yanbarensis]